MSGEVAKNPHSAGQRQPASPPDCRQRDWEKKHNLVVTVHEEEYEQIAGEGVNAA